jgi:hypothetical protein
MILLAGPVIGGVGPTRLGQPYQHIAKCDRRGIGIPFRQHGFIPFLPTLVLESYLMGADWPRPI